MANHPIVHVEIPTSDNKAAAEFYSSVFDWKMELDPTFDYLQFEAEGGPGGGFVKVGNTEGPTETRVDSVLMYIGSDDIEGTLARIEAKGGQTVAPKMEIPGIGWFAIFKDPTGNRMALYTALPK